MIKLKTVMIDLDGTLIDSIGGLYQTYIDFLNGHGIKGNRTEFNTLNGPTIREVISILKSKYNLAGNEDDLYQDYMDVVETNYKKAQPFPHAEEFLRFLKLQHLQIILVTSSPRDKAKQIVDCNKWNDYFDCFVFGDEVKKSKPDPEIYINAMKKSYTDKGHIIAIEDSINGIQSARFAGIDTVIGMTFDQDAKRLKNSGATHVFSSFLEVKNFFKGAFVDG